jgi:hypothetical protein
VCKSRRMSASYTASHLSSIASDLVLHTNAARWIAKTNWCCSCVCPNRMHSDLVMHTNAAPSIANTDLRCACVCS